MLGRLKMDVDECIDAYNKLSSQAFTRKALFPIDKHGNIKERFDSKQLELALKGAVMDRGYDQDTLLKDPDTSCRVVLCATQGETGKTVPLRSYANARDSSELYDTASIWETGRATSGPLPFSIRLQLARTGKLSLTAQRAPTIRFGIYGWKPRMFGHQGHWKIRSVASCQLGLASPKRSNLVQI